MPQFNQIHIFSSSLMLVLDGPGVPVTSQQTYLKGQHASLLFKCDLLKSLYANTNEEISHIQTLRS